MALQRDIRIHQYVEDCLVRARSHQTHLQYTQILVARLASEQEEIRAGHQTSL